MQLAIKFVGDTKPDGLRMLLARPKCNDLERLEWQRSWGEKGD